MAELGAIIGVGVLMGLFMVLGLCVGEEAATSKVRKEAVDAKVGEFYFDRYNVRKFRFITKDVD